MSPLSLVVSPLLGLLLICIAGELLGRWGWGRYLSAPAIIIALAMLAANTGVLPVNEALYNGIVSHVVPTAIVLLLVHANLRSLWQAGGTLVLLFLLATAATLLAGALALWLIGTDNDLAQLVPVFVATYVGGSVNFVAASQSLASTQPDLVAAALAADAVVAVSYLVLLVACSALATLHSPTATTQPEKHVGRAMSTWLAIPLALGFAAAIVISARLLVQLSGYDSLFFLYLIILTVVAANLFPGWLGRLRSAPSLGVACMYLFFAVIGASTKLSAVSGILLQVIGLAAFIVTVHAFIFFGLGRYFHKDIAMLITASNACILGPATAAAVASSRGWQHLVAPATLCGVLGYVIANFVVLILLPLLN